MRKAIFLAAEAWRQHYGQLATSPEMGTTSTKIDFELPSGEVVTLPGRSTREKSDADGTHTVYVTPMATSTILWLTPARPWNV